jgi:hypothetical protein
MGTDDVRPWVEASIRDTVRTAHRANRGHR